MELLALPAFDDNYIWMLCQGREALVVDPGDAVPVLEALAQHDRVLSGILVTHHHGDHTGGLAALLPHLQGPVWGPARERMPVAVTGVDDGDQLHWAGLVITVIAVPGHTAGHVAYHLPEPAGEAGLLFCGDTLFSGGCGRLFEGTPAQMHASLSRLAALPDGTRVCCAHEYTLSNLRFARAVEPDNAALERHQAQVESWRQAGQASLPSRIGLEREINPFLRCTQPAVAAAARTHGARSEAAVDVLAALRAWKNEYR